MADKENKYIVLKIDDLDDILDLSPELKPMFSKILTKYDKYRELCGKEHAVYIVCNQDEHYADKVWEIILDGEDLKNGIKKNQNEKV